MRKGWFKGIVTQCIGSRSYLVQSVESGQIYQRNRVHIRPDKSLPAAINNECDAKVVPNLFNNNHNLINNHLDTVTNPNCTDFGCYLFDDTVATNLYDSPSSSSTVVPRGNPVHSSNADLSVSNQSTVPVDPSSVQNVDPIPAGPPLSQSPTQSESARPSNSRSRRARKPPPRFADYEVYT